MILNIENYTVKIDFEARTVEVAKAPLNVATETLAQAVERVSQPTLNQWIPTDEEMVEMHQEMNPKPHRGRRAGIVEAEPREVCRSTCCGTLGRRARNGSCAGCRGMTDSERETLSATNHALLYAVGLSL